MQITSNCNTTSLEHLRDELHDTFYSSSKKTIFHVRLNSLGILLQKEMTSGEKSSEDHHLFKMSDIIGGRCVRLENNLYKPTSTGCVCTRTLSEKGKPLSEDAYLYVFAYILKKNKRKRERTVITLRFRTYDNQEDNIREAEKWYKILKMHRHNYLILNASPALKVKSSITRLLILLNPKSGSGKARELFNQKIVPVLNEAEISYDLHVTKHSNYAFEFIRKRDISAWTGIAAIGGDGLFHEILNGLLKRIDWEIAIENISLGVVPCGSGNGLAKSIAFCYDEPYAKPLLSAALTLVSGYSTEMDVVEIEVENEIIYSFLSVGWGLISDIDIESERLRPLGYRRFTIWTLHRLIKLRTYKGRISYLLKNECSPYENVPPKSVSKNVSVERSLSCNFIPSNLTKSYNNGGHIRDTDFEDVISLETVANPSFRSRCGSWLSSGSRRSTYYSIAESVYHSISDSEYNPLNDEVETNENDNMEYICLSKKRAMPLPSDEWVVEDGEFVMIHAAYQSHLSSDCHFAPQSMLNDGTIHLVIIYGGISRSQLLTFLINMSSGTHLPSENTDYIRVVRVEAFHLEPHENNGIITVDGERVKCAPLRARIIPKSVNIMIPNNMQ